jgi:hypothetical protein
MSDYPSAVLETPMLGEAQFDVPTNNPHKIRGNTLMSELEKKKPRDRPDIYVEEGQGIIKRRLPFRRLFHRHEVAERLIGRLKRIPVSCGQWLGLFP